MTRFLEKGYNVVGTSRAISASTNLTPSPRLALVGGDILCTLLLGIAALWATPRSAHAQLYVGQSPPGTVGQYNATSGAAINASFITGLNDPDSFALSGNTLFVSDFNLGTVGQYNATTGAVINANLITGLSNPVELALSGNTLFVVNFGSGTVGEYNATTGAAINANFITLPFPTGLDASPVPEPSTWSMIAVGSVALFGIMLRKKHRTT